VERARSPPETDSILSTLIHDQEGTLVMNPGFVFLTALLPASPAVDTAALVAAPIVAPGPTVAHAAPAEDPKPAAAPTDPKWTGSVALGASFSDGNTRARTANMSVDAERRAEKDRWTAKGYWNYAENKGSDGEYDITQRRAGVSLKYDYFLTKKLYAFGVAGIETDLLADIDKRMYAGAGAGYQWRESDRLKWSSEVGITYFKVDYGHSEDKDYPAGRLADNIEWKMSDTTALSNSIEAYPSLEDSKDFYGKSDTKLKANFTKSMFAQLEWVYQFNNTPADDKNRQDNLVILGIGWGF
jgi:putative salt-induced outer membrane protein YdiY